MTASRTLALLRELSPDERARAEGRFEAFVSLILRWNRSIKLVAAADGAEIYERHVLDSLAVVAHVSPGTRVVDVGAGGGFPSVVLAIAQPAVDVTALEGIHKKHAFLATVRRELALDNFHPLAERDEQHLERADFSPYDVATSRATFAVPDWLDRGLRLVRPGGIVIAMEAREQHALPAGTVRAPYPLGDRQRALLIRTRGLGA